MTAPQLDDPGADVFYTLFAVEKTPDVTTYMVTHHIEPDGWYVTSSTGKKHPLWLRSTLDRFVARREAAERGAAEAVAALDAAVA